MKNTTLQPRKLDPELDLSDVMDATAAKVIRATKHSLQSERRPETVEDPYWSPFYLRAALCTANSVSSCIHEMLSPSEICKI